MVRRGRNLMARQSGRQEQGADDRTAAEEPHKFEALEFLPTAGADRPAGALRPENYRRFFRRESAKGESFVTRPARHQRSVPG